MYKRLQFLKVHSKESQIDNIYIYFFFPSEFDVDTTLCRLTIKFMW